MTDLLNDESIQRSLDEVEELGADLAVKQAIFHKFEAEKKAILAQEQKLAESKGHTSVAAQEREAYASGRYMEWVINSSEALEQRELAANAYWARKMRFEAWRTKMATERALANLQR